MRTASALPLFLLLFAAVPLTAQDTAPLSIIQELLRIDRLKQSAHSQEAITAASTLLTSSTLTPLQRGKALNLQGLAYEDTGNLAAAQHAYEQALTLLTAPIDRAAVLDDMGHLYLATNQFRLSTNLRLQALQLDESASNHRGIAIISNNLAALALAQRHLREAERYIHRSQAEAKLTNALDPGDLAPFASIQAWLYAFQGESEKEIAQNQQALTLWRQIYNEDHPAIAWGRVLLAGSYARAGMNDRALAEIQPALTTLRHNPGEQSGQYLSAELVYAQLLDRTGSHQQAAQLRSAAESVRRHTPQPPCNGCTITVTALRSQP